MKIRMLRAVFSFAIDGDRFRRFAPIAGALLIAIVATSTTFAQPRSPRVTIIELDSEPVTETWRYQPATLTIAAETKVTWLNTGRGYHTVTSPEGLFDSGYLESGEEWSYEFDTPGVYNYFNVPYPWMKGTVIVREKAPQAARAEPTTTSTPSPTATPTP